MTWLPAGSEAELKSRGRKLLKTDGRQIAMFHNGEQPFAIDNRCPHEGYPLLQGGLGDDCVLTCQWHNWKFDLRDGQCLLGQDHVRAYPIRVADGQIEIDLSDPPPEEVRARLLAGLRTAVAERQYGRISRELARLEQQGFDPLQGVREVLRWTHDRFEFGASHALPACADWLQLYQQAGADAETRLLCLTEAIDHFAHDTLRAHAFPYSEERLPFDGDALLAAIEAEDEPLAIARLRGALAEGLPWAELEGWYTRAALAHYNDFGHALIYVTKLGALITALGEEVLPWLLLPLTRGLCLSTREDLIPDFKGYAAELAAFPQGFGAAEVPLASATGLSVQRALRWTREAAVGHSRESIYRALLAANCDNLLRFDEARQHKVRQPVSKNVGWLHITHGLTFSNAVRQQCTKFPELWPAGLLQMACFSGRNQVFVAATPEPPPVPEQDPEQFFARWQETISDHGYNEPIYACHLLKTFCAVREEHAAHSSRALQRSLRAGLERFLSSPIKQKHARRTAFQNLRLVRQDATPK